MGTLLEYLKAPPPVDAAPLDSIPFGLIGYKLPTLRINLPQTGSEPLRVPVPAPEVSGRPVAAYASAEPQGQGQEGFKERWASWSSSAANIFGAPGWLAQNKGQIPDQPTVLYGDTGGQQPLSYAATEPGKPLWLLSAFPRDQK
jgi:adhesin transport system outer membrane protein